MPACCTTSKLRPNSFYFHFILFSFHFHFIFISFSFHFLFFIFILFYFICANGHNRRRRSPDCDGRLDCAVGWAGRSCVQLLSPSKPADVVLTHRSACRRGRAPRSPVPGRPRCPGARCHVPTLRYGWRIPERATSGSHDSTAPRSARSGWRISS